MTRLTRKERHKNNFLKTRQTEIISVREPVLIVCEDGKSSVYYLREKVAALRLEASKVKITGESDPQPEKVVEFARVEYEKNKKECNLSKQASYKSVYCVMDVDEHINLTAAIDRCRALGFIPIVTNQSFELWYLLHLIEDAPTYLHRDEINSLLSKALGKRYEKGAKGMYELLNIKGKESRAIEHAVRLLKDAEDISDERNPYRNPSTEVHLLIKKLHELAGR